MGIKQKIKLTLLAGLLISSQLPAAVLANNVPQSSSTNYRVNEVFFGSGGALHNCSANYCSKQSLGETAVGNPTSSNYQARAGFNTDRVPYLQFTVNNTNIDIGTLSSSTTRTATATFSVKSYLSSGYIVKQTSDGPTNGSFTMTGLATPTASATGTEQFGINLVANTNPTTFGAAPSQSPDASYGFGQAASGYNGANLYKYVKNDTIAYSNSSSGTTNYTISYIFNVSNLTAGGTYTLNHVLVATSTF